MIIKSQLQQKKEALFNKLITADSIEKMEYIDSFTDEITNAALSSVDTEISNLLVKEANTPLDKRNGSHAWEVLIELRHRILKMQGKELS